MNAARAGKIAEVQLPLGETAALYGVSERRITQLAASGQITAVKSESRSGNGKQPREYLLSSFPADIQAKFAREPKNSVAITPFVATTLPLFGASPEVPEPIRLQLDEEERKEADRRFEAIAQMIEFEKNGRERWRTVRFADGKSVETLDDVAEYVGAQQSPSVSSRTLYRWLKLFRKGGYAALARKIRCDEGKSRVFETHPAAKTFVMQKFLNEALSAQLSWEALRREWKKLTNDGDAPSYATTLRFLSTIPEGPRILAREGAEKYSNRCAPFILRKAPAVMDWWVSDHRQHDIFVRNRSFDHLDKDQMYRPWLTAVYDWGSRKIVGFCWAPSPSSATIGSALRMAARQFGFARNLYWDNGKDFKKVRRELAQIDATPAIRGLLSVNGVKVTSALPKHPRSKPIESWFVRPAKRFDPIWGAAYAGNKPENCRPECREAQRQHAKYLAGKSNSSPLPTDAEFIMAAVEYFEEYNATAHLDCLDGRTPNEVFEQQYPPESRRKADELSLNILLSKKDERTVLAGGCVEINKLRYEPDEESLGALDLLIGQRAMILRDPYNLGDAVALDERGRFVGMLHIQTQLEQNPGGRLTQDHIKAAMKRQRTVKRNYVEGLAAIAAFSAGQGWKSEREGLVERALARTGTDGRLLADAAPGARGGAAPVPRGKKFEVGPAFVNDAGDDEVFSHIEQEK